MAGEHAKARIVLLLLAVAGSACLAYAFRATIFVRADGACAHSLATFSLPASEVFVPGDEACALDGRVSALRFFGKERDCSSGGWFSRSGVSRCESLDGENRSGFCESNVELLNGALALALVSLVTPLIAGFVVLKVPDIGYALPLYFLSLLPSLVVGLLVVAADRSVPLDIFSTEYCRGEFELATAWDSGVVIGAIGIGLHHGPWILAVAASLACLALCLAILPLVLLFCVLRFGVDFVSDRVGHRRRSRGAAAPLASLAHHLFLWQTAIPAILLALADTGASISYLITADSASDGYRVALFGALVLPLFLFGLRLYVAVFRNWTKKSWLAALALCWVFLPAAAYVGAIETAAIVVRAFKNSAAARLLPCRRGDERHRCWTFSVQWILIAVLHGVLLCVGAVLFAALIVTVFVLGFCAWLAWLILLPALYSVLACLNVYPIFTSTARAIEHLAVQSVEALNSGLTLLRAPSLDADYVRSLFRFEEELPAVSRAARSKLLVETLLVQMIFRTVPQIALQAVHNERERGWDTGAVVAMATAASFLGIYGWHLVTRFFVLGRDRGLVEIFLRVPSAELEPPPPPFMANPAARPLPEVPRQDTPLPEPTAPPHPHSHSPPGSLMWVQSDLGTQPVTAAMAHPPPPYATHRTHDPAPPPPYRRSSFSLLHDMSLVNGNGSSGAIGAADAGDGQPPPFLHRPSGLYPQLFATAEEAAAANMAAQLGDAPARESSLQPMAFVSRPFPLDLWR